MNLGVAYWDNEDGRMPRALEIQIDGETLVVEKDFPNGKENKSVLKEYRIPSEMTAGKEYVRVSFRAADGGMAARIFDVRLLKAEK